jgi:hypothetical protein
MRSLKTLLVFVAVLVAPGSLAHAQGADPASAPAKPAVAATKEEVNQLRNEVAAQRQTIEELKALVEKLAESKGGAGDSNAARVRPVADAGSGENSGDGTFHLRNAVLTQPDATTEAMLAEQAQSSAAKKKTPITAGWNGDHFFIRSADNKFQLQPYGYFMADYRGYHGDGAPPNTFLISRARFGFQGNYGTTYDYALLIDAAATNGVVLRDLYVNIKPSAAFQFQAGQYKEPFAQEALTNDTSLDFVERSLASLLYPSASSSYRSPGVAIHGELAGGVAQYWVGAFNGKGMLTNNTTNEPEIIGRLRFYQFRRNIGSEQGGNLGFDTLAGIVAKAGYVQATYLLTGETRPENGSPKVIHAPSPREIPAVSGPSTGCGKWRCAMTAYKPRSRAYLCRTTSLRDSFRRLTTTPTNSRLA